MNYIGLQTLIKQEVQRFLRVTIQTLITPWISAVLYIFVFGSILGSRIDKIEGVPYITFVLPGVLMMNVLSGAFAQSSSSLYFQRFTKNIEERLVAPLSYAEMVIGYLVGAVARAVVIGIGIMIIGVLFNAASMYNFPLFMFYIVGVSIIFGLIGLLVGLWSNNFEQLSFLNTFVIMPLSFIGGMFNSINMLPASLQLIARFNPFLYFNDGIRYSMTGYHETNILAGMSMIVILSISLFALTWRLFSIGWKLRV
jgi:ABC-2 type transport system permease protein